MFNLFPTKLKSTLCILLAVCTIATFAACGRDTKPVEEPTDQPTVEQPKEEKVSSKDLIKAPDNAEKLRTANVSNKDSVAWLTVPNTTINNPVMQGKNNDFYHRLDENKQYNFTGCFYADYENMIGSRDILSKNTLIYGHNIDYNDNKDGQRFSQLFNYADIKFVKENPYIFFESLDEPMVFEIFAVTYTATNFRYIDVNDMTGLNFSNFINEARLRSEYSFPDVEVTADDKVIVLSTCSYKFGIRDDVRFIVVGKLLPADAVLKKATNVVPNANIKAVA